MTNFKIEYELRNKVKVIMHKSTAEFLIKLVEEYYDGFDRDLLVNFCKRHGFDHNSKGAIIKRLDDFELLTVYQKDTGSPIEIGMKENNVDNILNGGWFNESIEKTYFNQLVLLRNKSKPCERKTINTLEVKEKEETVEDFDFKSLANRKRMLNEEIDKICSLYLLTVDEVNTTLDTMNRITKARESK